MKAAFLGLGAIGAPMARHLAGRAELAVWNRTEAKATAFAAANKARAAATPAAAARGADVVITCLPTSREVESLLDGDQGLLAGMTNGTLLIDCTSGDPGKLTIMCGGDQATFDKARSVLESFGEKIVLCGPVGAGHAVKAVNQAMLGVHIWALAEGLVALQKAGVPTQSALDVINASSGRSNASMNLFPERVMTRAFPRTFRLALLDKDVRIAADFAREHGVASPLLQLTAELLRLARHDLGEEADHVEAVKVVEQWAGVEVGGTS